MSKRTISEHLRKRIQAKVDSGEIETPEVIERIRAHKTDQPRLPIELDPEADDELLPEIMDEQDEEGSEGMDVMEAFEALVEEREVFTVLQDAHQEGYMALLETNTDQNPYPEDDLRHEPWKEGFQDCVSEAEVVRVVIAAMGLLTAESEEDTSLAFTELEEAVVQLSEVDTLIEFWEKVTADG